MKTRERFEKLQTKYRELAEKIDRLESDLRLKYGPDMAWLWATRVEQSKRDALRQRQSKVGDKILDLLDEISPRHWRSGAPYHWICSKLTYEDAVKPLSEALSVVPPVAFGGSESERRRFAGVA